jgi:proteasome accessory factor A
MNRIAGLETEYGCLGGERPGMPRVENLTRDWVFQQAKLGLVDLHQRDWDEPAGNGGFLFNGARVYVDMGHLEYCTPECRALLDVLRYDRAGDRILNNALDSLGLAGDAGFVRNNIDHYTGATFGCHENYLVRRAAPLTERNVHSLLAFLTLRLLYTGAGRVGATKVSDSRATVLKADAAEIFQMSQRADYINNDLFEWVQFNRAIINTRDEPLADGRLYRRLHLLHGDTNVLSTALLLKVGTTALVLDLLEAEAMPPVRLADPVATFHQLSRETSGPWRVPTREGSSRSATELLALYARAARREFWGRDTETDFLIETWEETLKHLETAPERLVGQIDWITKKWLLEQFMAKEGVPWSDPWLKSQDLEYHHLDPERGLGLALEAAPDRWRVPAGEIDRCILQPPADTRALARSHAMRRLADKTLPYYIDWEIVGIGGGPSLSLENPLSADPAPVDGWIDDVAKNYLGEEKPGFLDPVE